MAIAHTLTTTSDDRCCPECGNVTFDTVCPNCSAKTMPWQDLTESDRQLEAANHNQTDDKQNQKPHPPNPAIQAQAATNENFDELLSPGEL